MRQSIPKGFVNNNRTTHAPYIPIINGRNTWRPIIIFRKGGKLPLERGIFDYVPRMGEADKQNGKRMEKEFHDWQQPLAEVEHLLERFSHPSDLVCDPFGGSFTTALACKRNGRRFIGCDIEANNCKIGKYRVIEG